MTALVSPATYAALVAQRDAAAQAVTQATQLRDESETQRISMQQQLDDFDAVVAELITIQP